MASASQVLKNARALADDEGHVYYAVEVKSDVAVVEEQQREIRDLRGMLAERYGFQGIVGASPEMKTVFDIVKKAALSDAPVLIYGESGTGKGLVAKAIHKLGKKSRGPFIRVNSAALSESLLESELFGHVKGAFTGADRTTKGRFEAAHTGDIFLDEIGDISPSAQVRLLRVVEETRAGAGRRLQIDTDRCPSDRGDPSGPAGTHQEGTVSRRSLLPSQRDSDLHPTAPRALLGHSAAGPALHPRNRGPDRKTDYRDGTGGHGFSHAPHLAGKRQRINKCHSICVRGLQR